MRVPAAMVLAVSLAGSARAQLYDLRGNWSDASNPNWNWSYMAGATALPHVPAWQVVLGGWTTAQPAWAFSADGTNRLPVFFQSNGSENFAHDWLAGDIVVHSQDDTNGVGSGPARVVWVAPAGGTVTLSGAVWPGRSIGRANHWTLYKNQTAISDGQLDAGGPYSRSASFQFAAGSGGAGAIQNIAVQGSDQIVLEITRTSQAGDFVGLTLRAAFSSVCYVDCDHAIGVIPCLNVLDFGCFLNSFAAGSPYCNCDNSTTPPVLNVLDFTCFLNRFTAGCSSC